MANFKTLYFSVVLSACLIAFMGCTKNADLTSSVEPPAQEPAATSVVEPESAPVDTAVPEETGVVKEAAPAVSAGLQPIPFDYDQSYINEEAKEILNANAEWLKANSNTAVRIEGHCDERGTAEYNQALGQRRAASAKNYLVSLGISSSRISLISYGKEKPVCGEDAEECWRKNRRDEFVPEIVRASN